MPTPGVWLGGLEAVLAGGLLAAPAVSTVGLIIMAVVVLVGGPVVIGRRRPSVVSAEWREALVASERV